MYIHASLYNPYITYTYYPMKDKRLATCSLGPSMLLEHRQYHCSLDVVGWEMRGPFRGYTGFT